MTGLHWADHLVMLNRIALPYCRQASCSGIYCRIKGIEQRIVAESFILFALFIGSDSFSLTMAVMEQGFGNDDHHSNKTNERNIHKCDLSDNAFLRQRSMRQHLKTKHNGEKSYKCNQCNYASSQIGSF